MITNSREWMACTDWNTQLSDIMSHPPGLEQTLAILKAFISSRDLMEVVRGLKEEDGARLVDVLDQVRWSLGYPRSPDDGRDD